MSHKLAVLFVAIGLSLFLTACEGVLTDEEYVARAQDLLDADKPLEASVELKNALQQNRNNPRARLMLGGIYLEAREYAGALKELLLAQDLGVSVDATAPGLARAFLGAGEYEELLAIPEGQFNSGETKASVLTSQGLALLNEGDLVGAAEKLEAALMRDPQSKYARTARARVSAAAGDAAFARRLVDEVLTKDERYAPALSLLGELEESSGNLAEAEAAYTAALENSLVNFVDLLSRAKVRLAQENMDGAQADINVLKKRFPNSAEVNYLQGLVHFLGDRLSEAEASLGKVFAADERYVEALYLQSVISLRLGKWEQAEEWIKRFDVLVPRTIVGHKLLALLELRKGGFAEAERLITPVVNSAPEDTFAINLLANAQMNLGKTESAITWLRDVVTREPKSVPALRRLGTALVLTGESKEGLDYLNQVLEIDPNRQDVYTIFIRHYLASKDYEKALAAAESLRGLNPDSAIGWNMVAGVLERKGDKAAAAQAFARGLELSPGDPIASQALATLAVKDKEYDKARAYYSGVLEKHEDHLSTLLNLAILEAIQNNEAAVLEHLERASAAHPKAVRPQVMLARVYLSKGLPEKVASLMVQLTEEQKSTVPVLEVTAYSQIALEDFRAAKYSLEQLLALQPQVAEFHFEMGKVQHALGQLDASKRALQRTVELDPKHLPARVVLTRLALLENDKFEAGSNLAVLEKLVPNSLEVLRLKGVLAKAGGDSDSAVGLFEQVFEKSPTTRSMLSISREKWALGDAQEAIAIQEKWVEDNPDDLVATLALAGSHAEAGQLDESLGEYRSVLRKDEKNVVALNDLAWNLRSKEPGKALEYAQKAYELSPNSPQVLDTLAIVQLNNRQFDRASRSIERALRRAPGNGTIRYHGALIAEASGDTRKSAQMLSELLQGSVEFPERDEAKAMLQRLRSN